MRPTIPVVLTILAGTALLWRCGGTSGDECSPECGPGLVCYYGTCVPDHDADGDAEVGTDVWPEVDAEGDADGDADGDVDGDADAEPDGVSDVPSDGETLVDVLPEAETIVDVWPEAETIADVWPDTETYVDVWPDTETFVDVWPDTDITDVVTDTVLPCGPWSSGRCPEGQVCDIRSCLDGASGTCVLRPSLCMPLWAPVCGCDGVTYGNDCERLAAGAALDHEGECAAPAAPMCVPTADGGAAWLDGDGTYLCRAACTTCTAACLYEDTWSEGWYAVCSGSGSDGGCGMVPGLIEWTDCSP